jgi:two-component system LytT family response regulator
MKNKITAIIVDDEPLSVEVVLEYLKPFPEIEVSGKFTKSKLAVENIIRLKPDLLFLDIQMPVLDGFQVLEQIMDQHDPYIVFTTAFDQYAIQAFEVNAIGYLLKPFDKEKFDKVLKKAIKSIHDKDQGTLYDNIMKLLAEKNEKASYLSKIQVKDPKRIFFIPIEEILYFEASGDYVNVVTAKSSSLIYESLSALEEKLNPANFVRIHRSTIVNTDHVKEYIPYLNGEFKVLMKNEAVLKLSRSYKDNLKRIF